MGIFTQTITLRYQEVVEQLTQRGITGIAEFLELLQKSLEKKAQPEEESALLAEDMYL
jgi:hypothetical protein